jgi:hypothetical protein
VSNYNPSANNSIDFNCPYSPPQGLVSVNFPDSQCADFGIIDIREGSYASFELTESNTIDAIDGETLSVVLETYKLLNDVTAYDGQTCASDVVITAYFVASAHDGSALEQVPLYLPPAALLEPRSYSGENTYSDLLKSVLVSPDFQDGEENVVDLDTHPSFSLGIISFTTGEVLQPVEIYNWTMIPQDYVSGEYSNADVEINLPDILESNNYGGEYAELDLFVTPHFSYDYYVGENLDANLTLFPSIDLGTVNARAGEVSEDFDLYTYRLLGHVYYGGELTQFDISYVVNPGSPGDGYGGENLNDVALSTKDALPSIAYGGEYGNAYLSTSQALEPLAYDGQLAASDLQPRPPVQFSINGYSGELLELPYINYTTKIGTFSYGGEVNEVTITTFPSPGLSLLFYTGEYGEASIQVSKPIGVFNHIGGETGVVDTIDFLENYKFPAGENLLLDLRTETVLSLGYYDGARNSIDLTIRPSEGIGLLRARGGEEAVADTLKTMQHHDLYVVFWHDTHIQVDIDSQTYFDLTTDSCCGGPRPWFGQNFRIEMDFAEYPDQIHDGDHIVFHVDLSCRPRFKFQAHGGEYTDFIDRTVYIAEDYEGKPQINFTSGEKFSLTSFESKLNIRLCKGYFIPSGHNIIIELTDVLDENCYVDRIYTGESARAILRNTRTLAHQNYSGERLSFDLMVYPPWLFITHGGERLDFNLSTTISITSDSTHTGSRMSLNFYEPDWVGHEGQTASASMTLEVQIEFTEEGCLDNEYIYMNEDGDPIPEKFEPTPIELYPYQHNIKTRCF